MKGLNWKTIHSCLGATTAAYASRVVGGKYVIERYSTELGQRELMVLRSQVEKGEITDAEADATIKASRENYVFHVSHQRKGIERSLKYTVKSLDEAKAIVEAIMLG